MRTAILYISTGKYNQFFTGFYRSSKEYFLCNHEKQYFVFTDDISLGENKDDVHIIKKECRGFPLDSLFRFEMFLELEEQLKSFDYIFFFNANMIFLKHIGEDILPNKENGDLVAVIHPGFYNKPDFLYPYERKKKSMAYILPHLKEYHYFMGSLNGGKSLNYLNLIKSCAQNIRKDYENNIIAIVHDESHLNKYLTEHICLNLSPSYAYPDGSKLPFEPIILLIDKVKIDPYFNKGRDFTFFGNIKKAYDIIVRAVLWNF